MTDDDKSLGDQHTFDGETPDDRDNSLGDEMTYAEPESENVSPESLGDEMTFAGVADDLDDDLVDDGMEVIDLEKRYTIDGELGKGGMGEVLLATDTRLEIQVAIKRVLGKAARSKKAWQRFENGAKTIAKLDHPNIVRVYEYGLAKDGPFMVLECVTGGSLLDRCKQGPIPLEEAVDIACQLCDGIAKAHKGGIVHRDIKPANVLMTEEGIPKLNDFDLAKAETADMGMTQEGAVLGTLAFMPPEQEKDAALVDQRSDLWSLAATLYQMVTGEPPRVIDLDTVPQELRSCLAKALKPSKDDRYQSAREFRDALRASLSAPVPAAVEAVTDLGVGQCPECHARNSEEMKFCTSCTAALRVDCLNCGESIPVWHPGCGECGGRQSELIQQRKDEVDAKRTEAETLADQSEFDKAIALASEIVEIEDKRWAHQREWVEQFIIDTNATWTREKQSAQRYFDESQKHRLAFDYAAACQSIDRIPRSMRSKQIVEFIEKLNDDKAELDRLLSTIKKRISSRDLDGLRQQVDRAVELSPPNNNLLKLQKQLKTREGKIREKELVRKFSQLQVNSNPPGSLVSQWKTLQYIIVDNLSGQQTGPYSLPQMQALIDNRTLKNNTFIRRSDSTDWQKAASILGPLFERSKRLKQLQKEDRKEEKKRLKSEKRHEHGSGSDFLGEQTFLTTAQATLKQHSTHILKEHSGFLLKAGGCVVILTVIIWILYKILSEFYELFSEFN